MPESFRRNIGLRGPDSPSDSAVPKEQKANLPTADDASWCEEAALIKVQSASRD
jgi:hypothetical protein